MPGREYGVGMGVSGRSYFYKGVYASLNGIICKCVVGSPIQEQYSNKGMTDRYTGTRLRSPSIIDPELDKSI